jgi:hypothetical protein
VTTLWQPILIKRIYISDFLSRILYGLPDFADWLLNGQASQAPQVPVRTPTEESAKSFNPYKIRAIIFSE